MTDPAAVLSEHPCRLSARCHQWLEDARSATASPGIQRLIDELHDELWALGPIDGDTAGVVRGALASVVAAIHTDRRPLLVALTPTS